MMKPWFMNVNAMEPAMPSPQNVLPVERRGVALMCVSGDRNSGGSHPQNSAGPPSHTRPATSTIAPARYSMTPCTRSVKMTAVCPPNVT